jgi:hypothetical protein
LASARLRPDGATVGQALVIPNQISPSRAICPVKNPATWRYAHGRWQGSRYGTRATRQRPGQRLAKGRPGNTNLASETTAPWRINAAQVTRSIFSSGTATVRGSSSHGW